MDIDTVLLRAILATIARQTFPPEELSNIISSGTGGQKYYQAYNLCNGENSQSEIIKNTSFDKGNFSRTLSKWVDAGIILRTGEGREMKPLHVYPLPEKYMKKENK